MAKLLKDDFLQQNGYSAYDRYCPFHKTVALLRNMMLFNDLAVHVLEAAAGTLTWARVKDTVGDLMYKLSSMKFEDPADGEEVLRDRYASLGREIEERMRALLD